MAADTVGEFEDKAQELGQMAADTVGEIEDKAREFGQMAADKVGEFEDESRKAAKEALLKAGDTVGDALPAVSGYFKELYDAAEVRDWEKAEDLLRSKRQTLLEDISHLGVKLLRMAVKDSSFSFVVELVESFRSKELKAVQENQDLIAAAQLGDWKKAKEFLEGHPTALHSTISSGGKKLLHVAAEAGHPKFMEKLLEHYKPDELLSIRDKRQNTALHTAAVSGKCEVAKLLVDKSPGLTESKQEDNIIPILTATTVATSVKDSKELVSFLADKTVNPFVQANEEKTLLSQLTIIGFHGITLRLLKKRPEVILGKLGSTTEGANILKLLALRPYDFPSGSKLKFWEKWMYKLVPGEPRCSGGGDIEAPVDRKTPCNTQLPSKSSAVKQWLKEISWKLVQQIAPGPSENVQEMKQRHGRALELAKFVRDRNKCLALADLLLFGKCDFLNYAARAGIVEMISLWLTDFPYLVSYIEISKSVITPLHIAVIYRQEEVYNVILRTARQYDRGMANMIIEWPRPGRSKDAESVKTKYSIFHLAAFLAPTPQLKSVSGAALQMQRELQWFQEVGKLVDSELQEKLSGDGKTAKEIFSEEHKDLVEKAEEWMKSTSISCSVVATLIATVVFQAALTVPGGNDDQSGSPHFLGETIFTIFVVSDTLALFSSVASLLMFLSILTSRYAEEDFLVKLPMKLIWGFTLLFIAIATMMVAFGAGVWVILDGKSFWASVLATVSAAIPVATFLIQQLPMCIQTFKSTLGRGIFCY